MISDADAAVQNTDVAADEAAVVVVDLNSPKKQWINDAGLFVRKRWKTWIKKSWCKTNTELVDLHVITVFWVIIYNMFILGLYVSTTKYRKNNNSDFF